MPLTDIWMRLDVGWFRIDWIDNQGKPMVPFILHFKGVSGSTGKERSQYTVNKYCDYLSFIFHFGIDNGFTRVNPLKNWKKPKVQPWDLKLTLDDAKKIMEVVPLTLLTLDAWDFIKLTRSQCSICGKQINIPHKWAFYFLMAVGFWNFVGAGICGFLINLPIISYFEVGTLLTPNHGHLALMGVFGMQKCGIIRCQLTEDMCPGTTDFKVTREGTLAFEETGSVEIVGFLSCGGCSGKKAVTRAKMLVERGAEIIAFASCMFNILSQ